MITVFMGFLGLAYMHEQVHVQIFNSYDIESHVDYIHYLPDFATVPDGDYYKCNDFCVLSHNINESVGYHLIIIYVILGLGFLFIIGLLELIWKESS